MTNKVKYRYEFVTGKPVEIEVEENWAEILNNMDRTETNNNRRHTRRHEPIWFDGEWFSREELDPAMIYEGREAFDEMMNILNEPQRNLVMRVLVDGYTMEEYASECGVSRQAIVARVKVIKNKLKKFVEEPFYLALPEAY